MANSVHRWVILGFGAVGIIGILGWKSLGPKPVASARDSGSTQRNLQLAGLLPFAEPLADSQTTLVAPSVFPANDAVRRDPFASVLLAAAPAPHERVGVAHPRDVPAPAWHVSATLLAGDRRAAVIDDQLVYVGDRVPGGGTLTQVERDHVLVVDAKGATHVVAVQEGEI